MDFLDFFNMTESPFGETPDTKFYYASCVHEAALQKICWAIEENKSFILVKGEVGMGKTLLTRMLHAVYSSENNMAVIMNPPEDKKQLFQFISNDFGLNRSKASIDKLYNFFLLSIAQGKRNILVIDEAQELSDENLEFIRLLTNLETEKRKLLQVVLVAQPEIENRLQQNNLRQLYQRIFLQIDIPALSLQETESYIIHRIEKTGGGNFVRFDRNAISFIHQVSSGTPRIINKICELALCFAAKDNHRYIDVNWMKSLPLEDIGLKQKKFSFSFSSLLRIR